MEQEDPVRIIRQEKEKIFLNQNGGSKAISVYTEHDGNRESPKNSTKV